MNRYPKDEVPIGSLATSFRIVELLHESPPLTPSEVANELDIAVSTAHRHLTTLFQYGFVHKEETKFGPGLRFLEIGEQVRERMDIYRIAKPKIEELAERTGEIAHLMVVENGLGVRVCVEKGDQSVSTNTWVGEHVYLHTNSTGKAILAHLPNDRRGEIIERTGLPERTPNTITNPERLEEELAEIRERGIAFNEDERIEGLRAVAAPIQGKDDDDVAAISVAGPSKRLNGEWFRNELPALVSEVANEIELDLKYSRG
jgi:IclR family acetate operon transcriptional repressor